MTDPDRALDDAYRHDWAFVLAATVRVTADLDLAEESVQEAFVSALTSWREQGVPNNPAAWLTTTARRRAVDAIRRDVTLRRKLPLVVDAEPESMEPFEIDETASVPDDRLRLVFMCCNPALSDDAQVALTLRLVCGLSTAQIARAFLVTEPTMAARLTRGKKKIRAARIPFRVPSGQDLPTRLDAVLTVVHLFFTSGHTVTSGDALIDSALVQRSLDLARLLHQLLPDEPEVQGLLALLLLTDARSPARISRDGRLVRLEDQDRSLWRRDQIDEGVLLVTRSLRARPPGRFTLQAAIAAVHDESTNFDETDWFEILGLYNTLLIVWPSPVVALNRCVPIGMLFGWDEALNAIDAVAGEGALNGYPYLPATRADVLRRLGRDAEAADEYRQALALVDNQTERVFLESRLAGLSA